jgi:hypothetical protein
LRWSRGGVDIEPPLFVAIGSARATPASANIDGTSEARVAGRHRVLDGAQQGRAAHEGADIEGVITPELLADRSDIAVGGRTFMASPGSTPVASPSRGSTAADLARFHRLCLSRRNSEGENT